MEKYYTVDEVAEITGLTSRTIRTYIANGRLTGMRLGKQWRFTEDDISRLYTTPGGSGSSKKRLFKGPIEQKAEEFMSERHDSLKICVIADCAGMTDEAVDELQRSLREAQSAQDEAEITRHGSRIIFSGTAGQTSKLLKLIKRMKG